MQKWKAEKLNSGKVEKLHNSPFEYFNVSMNYNMPKKIWW